MDFLKDLSIDKVRNLAEDAFNQAKPKTEVEARVYEVLSHKNWGASASLMNEIAQDTYDYDKFAVVTAIMWESMENQRPAAWRVVFKGLTLLEHLVKNGSERCVDDARNHGHTLRALHQFNYYEGTVDRGSGVREKSKQLVEILADDERIREERQKARKLREKLGTKIGGVAGGGSSASNAYSGYGNDNWNSGGGAGGYGDGGIGSTRGRYDEDRTARATTAHSNRAEPSPTFAALPPVDDSKKVKKSKKKKKPEGSAAPALSSPVAAPSPEVDLFSFDGPPPAPAAAPVAALANDDFDSFQSAAPASAAVHDPFAQPPASATMNNFGASFGAVPQNNNFQAFGVAQQPQQQPMGAFTGSNVSGNNMFGGNVMGAMNGMGNVQHQQQMMGGGMSAPMGSSGPMGGKQTQQHDDDEFGDFANAAPSTKAAPLKAANTSNADPLSRLISLDSLSKNSEKKKDKLDEPIITSPAAAVYVQERDQIQEAMKKSQKGNMASFEGIDGLPKMSHNVGGMALGFGTGMGMMPSTVPAGGINPNVMGGGGGAANLIGMLDPAAMKPQSVAQPQGMNPQMQGMMQNMSQQQKQQMMMMVNQQNQQMGGGMTPQQQQQMMMMLMQQMQSMNMGGGGGMTPGMGAAGMTPGMGMQPGMGGMGMNMQGMGGSNMQQGMGGMGMNMQGMGGSNMQPGMGGMGMNMQGMGGSTNQMGGQPMGGWR